jgi:hypothetical protein
MEEGQSVIATLALSAAEKDLSRQNGWMKPRAWKNGVTKT